MKIADRVFGWLLVLGGVLHTVGATVGLKGTPGALVWPLAGSVAAYRNFLDPRGLYHVIVALVLAGFSIRTAVDPSAAQAPSAGSFI